MILSIIFFLLYIGIVIAIGIVSARKESEEEFMIAGRAIKGFQVTATMAAGFFDGAILSVYLAYIYQFGVSALWAFVGFGLGFLLVRRYAAKIKRKADELKVYTMPEYFSRLLGKRVGFMVSLFILIQFFLLLVVNLIISGKVLSVIFPLSYVTAVCIGGAVVLIYLLLAGFKAVVRTDFFQLIIMVVMVLAVALYFMRITTFTTSLNLWDAGTENVLAFLILGGLGIMVAPDIWQRIFASRDEYTLRKGLLQASFILPLLALVLAVVGIATKQAFPHILPENALVIGFAQLLPFGLREFGLVLLYAVALSSSDTITFVVSSIVTREVQNNSLPLHAQSMKRLTRIGIVMFILLALVVAIRYQNILTLGLTLASLNIALFPLVWGSLKWQIKESAAFWSLICTFVSVVILFIFGSLNPQSAVLSLPVAVVTLVLFNIILKRRVTLSSYG